MNEVVHPFDCDCERCTTHDEDGNEVKPPFSGITQEEIDFMDRYMEGSDYD